jgi:2-polyprenyl-3-methyl-5-hydroxy-6-metoxy-1,4-benzoquinol methylase
VYIIRDKDVCSESEDLLPLETLYNFPTYMGCVDSDYDSDIFADMQFCISKSTGTLQLNPVIDPAIVYQAGHDSGLTGKGWIDHHRELANIIHRHGSSYVFEVGGGHGILNAEYVKQHSNIPWTILEANPSPVSGCMATYIKGFYTAETQIPSEVDTIVHSHCLEHFYDPISFFRNVSSIKTGTKMIFSVPNLESHLSQKFTNVMNFEHTYFCNEYVIEYWLNLFGFDLIEKNYYKEDHSIFYVAIKSQETERKVKFKNQFKKNKDLFYSWYFHHDDLVRALNRKILNTDNPVFLFGAHVNSQFLLSFGLREDRIVNVLDNNTNKHNRRLYGSRLIVDSPSVLKNYESPIVILRSGVFNQEIKEDILSNINSTTIFLE